MNAESRFVYSAYAVGAAGQVAEKGGDATLVQLVLPSWGGVVEANGGGWETKTVSGLLMKVATATGRVQGAAYLNDPKRKTSSRVSLTGVELLGRVKLERVGVEVSSAQVDGAVALGLEDVVLEGLSVDGVGVNAKLMPLGALAPVAPGNRALRSVVSELSWAGPEPAQVVLEGNRILIPGVGKVILGELCQSAQSAQVTMFQVGGDDGGSKGGPGDEDPPIEGGGGGTGTNGMTFP